MLWVFHAGVLLVWIVAGSDADGDCCVFPKAGAVVAALRVMPKKTKPRVKKDETLDTGEDTAGHGDHEKSAGGTREQQNDKNDDHADNDDDDDWGGGGGEALPTVARGCGSVMVEARQTHLDYQEKHMHHDNVSMDGAAVIDDNCPPKHPYLKTNIKGGNSSHFCSQRNQE